MHLHGSYRGPSHLSSLSLPTTPARRPPYCMGLPRLGVLGLTRKLDMFWAVWELGALPLEHRARRTFHQVRSCLQMFTEGHKAS